RARPRRGAGVPAGARSGLPEEAHHDEGTAGVIDEVTLLRRSRRSSYRCTSLTLGDCWARGKRLSSPTYTKTTMPARATIITTSAEMANFFGLSTTDNAPSLSKPRYNVAPEQNIPAIRVTNGVRELVDLRWGLIPHWSRHTPDKP